MPKPTVDSAYDASAYPPFAVTVDLVIFTIRTGSLQVLLVERGGAPFAGRLALPGGFVQPDEGLDEAATRELAEETGIDLRAAKASRPEQLATYGATGRDPRMRVVTVAHVALLADLPDPTAGSDAAGAALVDVEVALRKRLAFDHRMILRDGLDRVRAKLEYTSIATRFCPAEFTLGELRRVYEAVWGVELDPGNFRRKILASGMVVEVPGTPKASGPGGGRPAAQYRAASAVPVAIDPPFRRPGD